MGTTKNLNSRWRAHSYLLRKGRHPEKSLQADWNEDGPGAFELVLIEPVVTDTAYGLDPALYAAERRWQLALMKRRTVLYNRTLPAPTPIAIVEWSDD